MYASGTRALSAAPSSDAPLLSDNAFTFGLSFSEYHHNNYPWRRVHSAGMAMHCSSTPTSTSMTPSKGSSYLAMHKVRLSAAILTPCLIDHKNLTLRVV
jgi:hypothetical protein